MQSLVSHLKPGDLLLMRWNWVQALPITHPWRIACTGIALGEKLALGEDPEYVHVGVVQDVGATIGAIEELADGCDRTQEPLDARWDVARVRWVDPGHPVAFVAYVASQVGTPYDYPGILFLGLERLLHDPNLRAEVKAHVCSTLVADGLARLGYAPPGGLEAQEVAPSDYPWPCMGVIIRAGVLVEGAA